MITYEIHKPFIMQLETNDVPFVSFDQYSNLVKLYRDDFYAAQHVDSFICDIGVEYNVWTVECHNRYYRHLWFDQIERPISISFEVVDLRKSATIPLKIKIFDADGIYFEQDQSICIERRVGDRFLISSWRKVEPVRAFVQREVNG